MLALKVVLAAMEIQSTGSHPPPRSPTVKLSAEDTKVKRIVKNSTKASLSTEDLEDTRLLKTKKEKINGKRNAAARSPLRCCQVL